MMSNYLPDSETYLAISDGMIIGFVAMVGNYLAALFIACKMQGNGTGKKLLNFIKENRSSIQLKAYKNNARAVEFYRNQGFNVIAEDKDDETGETEFLMEWKKE